MSTLSSESNALYEACWREAQASSDKLPKQFTQADLEELIECTPVELMRRINELTDHCLVRSVRQQSQISWILRSKDNAVNMASMSESEKMVFAIIEDAHSEGIWIKRIKTATNAPPNVVQRAVSKMEKVGLVKGIRNIKNPAQRVYMLSDLVPSNSVTGGSFFDGGKLDESMVEELSGLIVWRIRNESWIHAKRRVKHEAIQIDDDSHKRPRDSIEDDQGVNKSRKTDIEDLPRRHETTETIQLAYQPGQHHYPTTAEILDFIRTSGAMRLDKTEALTLEEIQGLINMLIWDGKLEQVKEGYRTMRGIKSAKDDDDPDYAGNGLTDIPCGRCQITNLCQEGTKVSAANCVYFQEWLTPVG